LIFGFIEETLKFVFLIITIDSTFCTAFLDIVCSASRDEISTFLVGIKGERKFITSVCIGARGSIPIAIIVSALGEGIFEAGDDCFVGWAIADSNTSCAVSYTFYRDGLAIWILRFWIWRTPGEENAFSINPSTSIFLVAGSRSKLLTIEGRHSNSSCRLDLTWFGSGIPLASSTFETIRFCNQIGAITFIGDTSCRRHNYKE